MDRAEPNNDAELLLDQTAWVQGLARSLAIDASGADDVAQEAMLAAWQAHDSSDHDVAGLRTWLTGVVRNLSNLRVRGESRRRVREEWVARPEPTPSAADTVSRAAQLRLVVDEVMDLDEPHRSTILLRYFDGLSTQRVAEVSECSPEAVRKRLSRALRKLRERLDQKHGGDGASWLTALTPLLGDLAVGTGGMPLAAGIQGGGKFGASGWTAVGSVAAGAALLVGGGAMLSSGAPGEKSLDVASASVPVAVLTPSGVTLGDRDRSVRVPLSSSGADDSAEQPDSSADQIQSESSVLIDVSRPVPPVRPRATASGHVFDLAALPVEDVDVFVFGRSMERMATTLPDGSFEATLGFPSSSEQRLVARSEHYATLRAARVQDLALHSEPIIIVAPRVDLGGQVLDDTGQSLGNVQITLDVSDLALHGFPHPLQPTVPIDRRFVTSADGRFQLDDWVTGHGLSMQIECFGYESLSLPVPERSDADLLITMLPSQLQVLHGVVLHKSGEPAGTARVQLGDHVARVDAQGLFRLEYDSVAPETVLRASSTGFVPAQIPSFGTRLASIDQARLPVRLVLGGPARSIAGMIHDHEGRPVEGWETYAIAVDETEAFLAQANPEGTSSTLTTADGRFLLAGLAETDYIIHAVNLNTLVMLTSDVVRPGQSPAVDLEVPEHACSSIQGRIVARDGAPLVDARVTVMLDRSSMGFDMEMLAGESVRTDGQGEFHLDQVPMAFVDLRVEHPDVFAMMLDLQSAPDLGALEFEIPRDRFIQMLDGGSCTSGFEILGEGGEILPWVGPDGRRRRRARVRNGRSAVVRATEDARELVVYDEAGAVQEIIGLDNLEQGVERVRPSGVRLEDPEGLK